MNRKMSVKANRAKHHGTGGTRHGWSTDVARTPPAHCKINIKLITTSQMNIFSTLPTFVKGIHRWMPFIKCRQCPKRVCNAELWCFDCCLPEQDMQTTYYSDVIWARWRPWEPASRLFTQPFRRLRSKKTSKLRVTGLCEGNSPVIVNSPHKGSVMGKMFLFDDGIIPKINIELKYIWKNTFFIKQQGSLESLPISRYY